MIDNNTREKMGMDSLVSIVVPVYNAERYIFSCVHALQGQDYSNIEIILVDDGSTDKSPSICDSLAGIDTRIKVVHKKNGGVSSARNSGIDVATGHYLMFADSDDLYEKDMVSRMVFLAERWNTDFVICGFCVADSFEKAQLPRLKEDTSEYVHALSKREFLKNLGYMVARRPTMFAPWNKLFVLDIVKKYEIRFKPEVNYGEDFLFNLQYVQYCNGVIETDEPLYNYLMQNPDSLEARYKSDLFENQTMLYMAAKQLMIENQIYEGANVYNLDCYYTHRILYCIKMQNHKENIRSIPERRQYVAHFFDKEDAAAAVCGANLTGDRELKLLTELVKAKQYDRIYDAIVNEEDYQDDELSHIRYKVIECGPGGIRWIPYTFKSVKKYGLIITVKRVVGKVVRKFGGRKCLL